MDTLSSIVRQARLVTFGAALATISLPNVARAQDASSAGDTALARQIQRAKISLQRGLSAATARGKPISAKYELE